MRSIDEEVRALAAIREYLVKNDLLFPVIRSDSVDVVAALMLLTGALRNLEDAVRHHQVNSRPVDLTHPR
jgi:hypothetical protein